MSQVPETEPKTFSVSEMRFITAFFTNMQTKPDVDWDKVATDASLKDSRCARDRFRQILAKHNCTTASATASPRKGKKAGDEEGVAAAPAKVTKKRAPRKKAVKKNDEDEEDGGGKVKAEAKGEKGDDSDTA